MSIKSMLDRLALKFRRRQRDKGLQGRRSKSEAPPKTATNRAAKQQEPARKVRVLFSTHDQTYYLRKRQRGCFGSPRRWVAP